MNAIPDPTLYERLLDLPDNLTGEILQGELHTQPRPRGPHAAAERGLNIDLGGPFDFGRRSRRLVDTPGAGGAFRP